MKVTLSRKGSAMMSEEAKKQKALQILREDGIAELLAAVYVESETYQDIDSKYGSHIERSDIDIIGLCVKEVLIHVSSYVEPVSLLCGRVIDKDFKIGGSRFIVHGKYKTVAKKRVLFYIGEKLHINVVYDLPDDSGLMLFPPSEYSLSDVEEFHASKDILHILKALERVINKEQKITQEKWERKNKGKFREKPKFTF